MNKFQKMSSTAILLALLGTTACSQEVPSDDNRVAPKSTSSTLSTPTPSAIPATIKPVPKATSTTEAPLPLPGEEGGLTREDADNAESYLDKYPLQINVDHALKEYGDPKIKEVFPEKDFDTKEGIRAGLSLYQDLTGLQDLYEPRDTKNDFNIVLSYADKMTAELIEKSKSDINEHGRFVGIPTADAKGSMGTSEEGIDLNADGVPISFWNSPAISTVYDKKYGNVIRITGKRTIGLPVESGEKIEIQQTYQIDVTPSGEKEWLVSDLNWTVESARVIK